MIDVNGIRLKVQFKKIEFENGSYDYFMNISQLSHLVIYNKKIFNKKCEELLKYSDEIMVINGQYWLTYDGFNELLLNTRRYNTDTVDLIIGKYRNKINKISKKRKKEKIKPYEYDVIYKKNGLYIVLKDISTYLSCPFERMLNTAKELKNENDILIYNNDYAIVNENGFDLIIKELNFKDSNKKVVNIRNRFKMEDKIYTIKQNKRKRNFTS